MKYLLGKFVFSRIPNKDFPGLNIPRVHFPLRPTECKKQLQKQEQKLRYVPNHLHKWQLQRTENGVHLEWIGRIDEAQDQTDGKERIGQKNEAVGGLFRTDTECFTDRYCRGPLALHRQEKSSKPEESRDDKHSQHEKRDEVPVLRKVALFTLTESFFCLLEQQTSNPQRYKDICQVKQRQIPRRHTLSIYRQIYILVQQFYVCNFPNRKEGSSVCYLSPAVRWGGVA